MSNRIRDYEEPVDDAVEAEVEEEFRFDLERARQNVLPRAGGKTLVTIFLDEDIATHFKLLAEQTPAVSYQARINQTLREVIGHASSRFLRSSKGKKEV
jgi:uncharacterized protein (DUF4415 family)